MESDFPNFRDLTDHYKELKAAFPKMSDYELMCLAVQIQRNDILVAGLKVSPDDSHPSALEAVAIQMGYGSKADNIPDKLQNISDEIERLKKEE